MKKFLALVVAISFLVSKFREGGGDLGMISGGDTRTLSTTV